MNTKINSWINDNALNMLRISIGIVYVWFGALKFFPQLSPADQLAKDTIALITFGLLSSTTSIILVGQYIVKNIIILCAAFVLNAYANGKIAVKTTA